MKKYALLLFSFMILSCVFLYTFNTKNQYQSIAIAVIDERKIRLKAKPFLKINEFVDSYRLNKQKEFKIQEQKFKKEYDDIQASLDSRSAIELRKQKFEEKIALLHKEIEEEKDILNEKLKKISDEVLETLQKIIKKIADERSCQIVLNVTDNLSFSRTEIDITDQIIEKLESQIDTNKLLS